MRDGVVPVVSRDTYYDQMAAGYDELHKEEQLAKLRVLSGMLGRLEPKRLLDVGCGTGIAASHFNSPMRVGIDPSRKLLELASDKGVWYLQACAESLPFKDGAFDFVVSLTAVHNFEDAGLGLSEMVRVCKPGGTVAVSLLKKASRFEGIREEILARLDGVVEGDEERDVVFVGRVK